MSPYQSMVKNIISSIEALEVLENEFLNFGIELSDGDFREKIRYVEEIIYDLDEMLEEGEDCAQLFMDIAEIYEGMSESENDYPKAICELEYAAYDLEEMGNKTACTIISSYLEGYKDSAAAIENNIAFFAECVSDQID